MDFPWLIARALDRLTLGDHGTKSRFELLIFIYGAVRAIHPDESVEEIKKKKEEEGNSFRSITDIMQSLEIRRKNLRTPEKKIAMEDPGMAFGNVSIDDQLDAFMFELQEVIFRCKITDKVRASEGEMAL
jgi:hypothetical protein